MSDSPAATVQQATASDFAEAPLPTVTADSQPAAAIVPPIAIPPAVQPAVHPSEPSKPRARINHVAARMAVSARREAIVSWWLSGNRYGNPRLVANRFSQHSLTHDALAKLIADLGRRGITLGPGLNFIESKCYQLPDTPLPRSFKADGTPKIGGGDSGVVVYHFSSINPRPGSYMLMIAAESVIAYFLERLVELMHQKRSLSAKTQTAHKLQIGYIADLLQNTRDPLLNYLAGFYSRWTANVRFHDIQTNGAKPGLKRKYLPLAIQFPDVKAIIGDNKRYLIDKMLATSSESRRKRGQALYARMVESGKILPGTARSTVAKVKEEHADGKKKKPAPPKSDLQKAIEADKQRNRAGESGVAQKRLKPSDPGYDITLYLTQKNFIKILLDRIPGTRALIGKIAPEVRRVVDDMFNELLVTLANAAISGMALAKASTLTKDVALAAINTFFDVIYGMAPSETRRRATGGAIGIFNAYESVMKTRREKARKKAGEAGEAGEADEADDEDEDPDEDELNAEMEKLAEPE